MQLHLTYLVSVKKYLASAKSLVGVALFASGLCLGGLSLGRALVAGNLDRAQSERAYDDLSNEISALKQGGAVLARVANLTTPSVVHIQSRRGTASKGTVEETGSGIIMTSGKMPGFFVITNRHVIDGAGNTEIAVSLHDGRVLNPERIWSDGETDLAVLKINGTNLVAGRWGDSSQLEIGHFVLAVGSPFGLSQSVTFGIISAKGRRSLQLGEGTKVLNQDFLQTDAAINPGNSGGPLLDLQGRVVGINTAIASSSGGNEGIGFSIPSNLVQRVAEQLLEYGTVQRAYLGVMLDPQFNAKEANRLKLDRVQGARVSKVRPNTPAARANLVVDDVVLTFDGTEVQDENHLINLVSLTPIGRQVKLVVWRGGQRMTISVLLADRVDLDPTQDQAPRTAPAVPTRPMSGRAPLNSLRTSTGRNLLALVTPGLATQLGTNRETTGVLVLAPFTGAGETSLLAGDIIESVGFAEATSVDVTFAALSVATSEDPALVRLLRRTNETSSKGTWSTRYVLWTGDSASGCTLHTRPIATSEI